jgi:hypothetical protein
VRAAGRAATTRTCSERKKVPSEPPERPRQAVRTRRLPEPGRRALGWPGEGRHTSSGDPSMATGVVATKWSSRQPIHLHDAGSHDHGDAAGEARGAAPMPR